MEAPPRQTSRIPLPEDTIIRKSAYGRAITGFPDVNDVRYAELKSGSSITQIVNDSHTFHSHSHNNRTCWDKPTDVVCYHCCHKFDTLPIPIPKSYDAYSGNFIVHGNFCSLCCAKTYILEKEPSSPHALTLFIKMAHEVYNVYGDIPTAPPREALKMFGGVMDIESFRSNETNVATAYPPFINSYCVIEERPQIEKTSSYLIPTGSVKGLKRPEGPSPLVYGTKPDKSPYQLYIEANS